MLTKCIYFNHISFINFKVNQFHSKAICVQLIELFGSFLAVMESQIIETLMQTQLDILLYYLQFNTIIDTIKLYILNDCKNVNRRAEIR